MIVIGEANIHTATICLGTGCGGIIDETGESEGEQWAGQSPR